MCVQAGLLAGLGVVFVGGVETGPVRAAPVPCQTEGACTFKRPLFGIVLDYSSSMNELLGGNTTRWQAAVKAIEWLVNDDNGYVAESFILGLVRFGHDPVPGTPGSKIAGDSSGLVDGQRLDVPWYDSAAPDKPYTECTNGDAIVAALNAAGPPGGGQKTGIFSWTKGALDFAAAHIAQAQADHPQDLGKRAAVLLLVTDGPWTNANGTQQLGPAGQDPKLAASALWMQQGVPTYVVALGEAKGAAFTDTLATAGGTTAAVDVADPQGFKGALGAVVTAVQQDVLTPACGPGMPRIMVLLDASSSMININNGMQHAPAGQGRWDQARDALAGTMSMFDIAIGSTTTLADVAYVGLAVFGHNTGDEHKLVVQYGPCRKDNIAWALDPATSCEKPGCVDPYAKPPISWTFKDGSLVDPMFADKTLSHMPRCDFSANLPNACIGSATYTHLGLDLLQTNLAAYKAGCAAIDAVQPCNDATKFINILIADGISNSTDAQVQAPLMAMHGAGVVTHVIGFGDFVNTPNAIVHLEKLADWGSGNALDYYDANNQDQLEAALKTIVLGLEIDECCNVLDCAMNLNPGSDSDPDPVVEPQTSSSDTGDTGTGTTQGTGDTGAESSTTQGVTSGTSTGDTGDTSGVVTASTGTTGTTDMTGTTGSTSTSTASDPTTTTDTPTAGTTDPVPTTTATMTGADASSSTGAGESETAVDGGGCTCTSGQGQRDGLFTLLSLGLAGLARRRRA